MEAHLAEHWRSLVETFRVETQNTGNPRRLAGTVALRSGRCLPADKQSATTPVRLQPFTLELRSLIAGDATLVECTSPVGRIDLKAPEEVDHLYDLQKELGVVRVCAVHDFKTRTYDVSIKGDRPFHLETTCYEEVERLVLRTVEAADLIESEMLNRDAEPSAWLGGAGKKGGGDGADAEA